MVLSSTVYGGTFNLIVNTMKKMGISCSIVDPTPIMIRSCAAFQENTKCVLAETIANPALVVLDIEKVREGGPCAPGPSDRGQYLCHAHQLQSL